MDHERLFWNNQEFMKTDRRREMNDYDLTHSS